MSKDKSTGKKLADMMYGNPEGAAFGIYPKAGKRSEDKQDREAAKNFPVDLARGVVAGAVGMPGDIESLIRMLPGLNEQTVLPTSEDVLKRIPFGSDSPTGRFASGLGTLIGGSAPVGPAVQGVKAGARGALSAARAGERMAERVVPQIMERGGAGADVLSGLAQGSRSNVIKPKGGNWLGGKIMGNIDENVRRLKPYTKAGAQPDFLQKELKSYEAALERLKNDKYALPQMVQAQQDVVDNIKKKIAVNNWVESNLGKYVKNQMGTPEDPVRKLFDKRTNEIEAKFAKDMERAKRVEDRAIDEPDPRRQANFLREAERLRNEATTERNFAMEHITHVPGRMEDYSPDADQYLKQRRADAGFPAEGMGESEMAKRWETLTDDAIVSMRAGDVQEMKSILAQAQDAERAVKTLEPEVQRRFEERIRAAGLNESEVASVMRSTPMMDKAAIIGDVEYQNLNKLYNDLSASLHRDEFAAGQQNPFIEKLDPETLLYSGNTADMGFDHVIDVLKQDVMEGRIRPEQLSKVSIEDAVRRTAEYDQEMAIKMRETAIKQQEGFPLYKEYPEGYRWIELKKPEDLPEGYSLDDMGNVVDEKGHLTNHPGEKRLEEALKYEGDTMGHCVGGYCPDVLEGRSRIYSLRDAKGEPHVTVETSPGDFSAAFNNLTQEEQAAVRKVAGSFASDEALLDAMKQVVPDKANIPENIVQIKGKQNRAPKEDYLPYVQDFVKSGQWSDVGDLQNTGLYKADPSELGMFIPSDPRLKNLPGRRTEDFEKAKQAGLFGDQKYFTRSEWEDILRKQIESESGPLPPLPEDGMARGGPVHFSDNPDVMQLELAAGGLVKGIKAAAKAVKGTQDVLPAAEREANKVKFLEPSKVKDRMYHATNADFKSFRRNHRGAHFVTPDRDFANQHIGDDAFTGAVQNFEEGANIMPVHVQVKKPFDYENLQDVKNLYRQAQKDRIPLDRDWKQGILEGNWDSLENEKIMRSIQDLGYDAMFVSERDYTGEPIKNLGIFDPRKIKSETGNRGTYDIEDPDITKADGGAVHMQAGGLAKAAKALKAAKVEKELALPPVLPRAPAKTKEEIRPYAQRMAQQMTGEFYRPNPKKSENVAGKSFSQFKMEKDLEHDIRPTREVVEPEVADIEKQLGMLKIGISGDTTIADKILHRAGPYELFDPSPQHGGPRYGLGGEGAWASNNPIAATVQKRVNELSEAYGAPPLGQYMAMGPQGSNFAQHFADANLQAIDTRAMTRSQIEQINKLIREGSEKSGPRPSFPGIEDKGSAYLHFAIDPELRKHFNDLMQKTSVTERLNLPDGRIILHAITEPELRDKEILNTGFSQMRLRSAFDPESLQISAHPTYSHVIPHEEGSILTRTKYPVPGELEFSDVLDYAQQHYRPRDMTRVFQTSTPRQIVDPQHIDEMKMYEELMKEYTGKKAGGEVKAPAAQIDGNQFVLAAQKYGLDDSMSTLNKMVSLVNQGATVEEAAQFLSTAARKSGVGKIDADNEQQVQNPVHFTESPDAMRLALTKRN